MAYNFHKIINPDAEYLSLSEIGKLFSPPISYVSLWKWQKTGVLNLTPMTLGNKKFYKKVEVIKELENHISTLNKNEN